MTSKRTSKKPVQIVDIQTMAAEIKEVQPMVDAIIDTAIVATLDAAVAKDDATSTFQEVAKAAAETLRQRWTALKILPKTGASLDAGIASIKKAEEAKGRKEAYGKARFDNTFSMISNFCYLWLVPTVAIISPKKSDKGAKIGVTDAGTNAAKVRMLAAAARKGQDTGRDRGAGHKDTSTPKIDSVKASQQAFEVDQKSVLSLIERTLKLDSGISLILEALAVYDWIVVPGAKRKAAEEAKAAELKAKQEAEKLAEEKKAALLAKGRRRSAAKK